VAERLKPAINAAIRTFFIVVIPNLSERDSF
jgi:hypothetical protein